MIQTVVIWEWLMEHLLYINLILSVVIVFFQRRDPKAVWTWLLLLYFIPVFGFFFWYIVYDSGGVKITFAGIPDNIFLVCRVSKIRVLV